MALRGRPPKAKNELLRGGSRRARAQPDDLASVVGAGAPNPPTWLKGEARAEWKRIVPKLEHALATIDRAGLVMLCEAWADYVTLSAQLAAAPQPAEGADAETWAAHATWLRGLGGERNGAYQRWVTLAQRFGLTPADRARVKLPAPAAKAEKQSVFDRRLKVHG